MKWTTEFNTYEQTMTHTLSEQVKVVTDFRAGTVTLIKEGRKVDQHRTEDFNIADYTDFLVQNKIDADKLTQLTSSLQEAQG